MGLCGESSYDWDIYPLATLMTSAYLGTSLIPGDSKCIQYIETEIPLDLSCVGTPHTVLLFLPALLLLAQEYFDAVAGSL